MAVFRRAARLLARWALCVMLLQSLGGTGGGEAEAQEETAYLLFSTQSTIYQLYLNGSTSEEILRPADFGVIAVDYHYRLNYMFWIEYTHPRIMRARLNGSELTTIVTGDLDDPADLAVDWINDKLYWVDRGLRRIEEYDIISGHRRVVISTGNMDQSSPAGLALYPYPNHGWLYWSDTLRRSIEMVSVTGENHNTFHDNLMCIQAMSVDYHTHTLYWINQCSYEVEAIRLDGDASSHAYPISRPVFFASALAVYQNLLFWAESNGVYRANRDVEDDVTRLFATSGTRATGVQVVHPSQQPRAEQYVSIVANTSEDFTFSCSSDCGNGNCIPPGLCACDAGWRGEDCSIDEDECSENNGGCSYQCTNLIGGFQCSCPSGYTLSNDQLTCTDLNECEGSTHGCQQRCINEEGSFSCGCNVGYILNEDGKTCEAIQCTGTIVTVTDAPSSTFDPCLYILPKTSSGSEPTSTILSVGPPTSTSTHIQRSTTSMVEVPTSSSHTSKITSSSILPTSTYIQRNTSSTIEHISPSTSSPTKITSSSVHEHTTIHIQRDTSSALGHISSASTAPTIDASSSVDQQTSVHSQRTTSSIVGQNISPSSSAPSKITSSSVDRFDVDMTTTVTTGTSTLNALSSTEMSEYHHVSSTVTSHMTGVTPTSSYSELPPSVQPDSTRTRPSSSASEDSVVSSTTKTGETTEEAKSSSSQLKMLSIVPFSPDVTIPEIDTQKSKEDNNVVLLVGVACGAVFVIVVVVGILLAIIVCCAHQKRHSGSWSPSAPKSNGTVSPTSMKPIPDANSSNFDSKV